MQKTKDLFYSIKLKDVLLISVFIIFIIPFSLNFGGGSSANYLFVLFPLFIILFTQRIKIPSKNIFIIMMFFTIVFFVSILYQIDFLGFWDRRILSFIIFMSIFSFVFINITEEMVKSFKLGVVFFSCVFCLIKISDYFILSPEYGGTDLGFAAKGVIGSQRFGFLYIVAFWILFFWETQTKFTKILKALSMLIIILGILNTFSRSVIMALSFSLIVYIFTKIKFKFKISKNSIPQNFITFSVFIIIMTIISIFFPFHVSFYGERILDFFLEGNFYEEITNPELEDSLGFRIIIFNKILDFVLHNPFTGSGFLGCWVMFESLSCSAHNQYADVFFRTGFLGICIYIFLLFRIFKYLSCTNRDLFFGFIAILIYGLVHETFKLSHGAFVLSFLLGMTYNKNHILNNKN